MANLERRIRSTNLSPGKQLELEIELLKLRERRQFRLALTEDLPQGGPDA